MTQVSCWVFFQLVYRRRRFPLLGLLILLIAAVAPSPGQARGAAFARGQQSSFDTDVGILASAHVLTRVEYAAMPTDLPHFSDSPTEQELLVSGVLPQPLAPVGGTPSADENRKLANALTKYLRSQESGALRDAVGPLTDFLKTHSQSPWRAALYMNLGLIYRQTGHMSKTLRAWRQA